MSAPVSTDERLPVIILCGGRGTRISEATHGLPKPMLAVGERPILWHIMKGFAGQGLTDFVLALGWSGDHIRRWFLEYRALTEDFEIHLGRDGGPRFLDHDPLDDWRVTCIDTGLDSLTGTRVRRASARLPGTGPVVLTYGDGLSDVDMDAVLAHHRAAGTLATLTAVRPPGRFGELDLGDGRVRAFHEKPSSSVAAINGGFMVLEREAIERYIPEDADVAFEREPLSALAADGQLSAYVHDGFWQPVDTVPELELLNALWAGGEAPWCKRW